MNDFNKTAEDLLMSQFLQQRNNQQISDDQKFLMSQFQRIQASKLEQQVQYHNNEKIATFNKTPSPKKLSGNEQFQPFSPSNDFDQTNDFDESAISNSTPKLLSQDPPKSVQRNTTVKEVKDILQLLGIDHKENAQQNLQIQDEQILKIVNIVTQQSTNTIINEFKQLQKQMELIQTKPNQAVVKESYDEKQIKYSISNIQSQLVDLKKDINSKYDERILMQLLKLNSPQIVAQKQWQQKETVEDNNLNTIQQTQQEYKSDASVKSIFIDQKSKNQIMTEIETENIESQKSIQQIKRLKQQIQREDHLKHRKERPKEALKLKKQHGDKINVIHYVQEVERKSHKLERSSSNIKEKQIKHKSRETLIINDLERTCQLKMRDVGIQQFQQKSNDYKIVQVKQLQDQPRKSQIQQQTSLYQQTSPQQTQTNVQFSENKSLAYQENLNKPNHNNQQRQQQQQFNPLIISTVKNFSKLNVQPIQNTQSTPQITSFGEIYPNYDKDTAQKYEKDGHGIGAWENSAYSNWNLSSLYKSEFSDMSEGEMRQNFAHVTKFPIKHQ
ncbi:hypothetical protein SS50377_23304 [Spironucleus salmonicida]|uniref:Uncharacterized protein n=1 Tax=Spironucleus salmonicida TaxID=348837 RepID=V6LSH3_9EUKA|nr:hypothetical protein SS50377_23304 [Spironucleus salmonicida]|eukprot:EST47173.1 Hypothetical protein SS50377_12684 [Spironucleus salmonicida]